MGQEQTEVDNSLVVTEDDRSADETADSEVDIHLPHGPDLNLGLVPQTAQMDLETVGADAATPDPGLHRRLGPIYELPTPMHSRLPPMTGRQPVTDFRGPYRADLKDTVRLPPMTGRQPVTDFRDPQWANMEDTIGLPPSGSGIRLRDPVPGSHRS